MSSIFRSTFSGNDFLPALGANIPRPQSFTRTDLRPNPLFEAGSVERLVLNSANQSPAGVTSAGGARAPLDLTSLGGSGAFPGGNVDPGTATPAEVARGALSAAPAIAGLAMGNPVPAIAGIAGIGTQDPNVAGLTSAFGRAGQLGAMFGPFGALVAAPFAAQALGKALDPLGQFDLFGLIGDRAATALGFGLASDPEVDIPGFDPAAFGPGFEQGFQGSFDPGFGGAGGQGTSDAGFEGIGDEAAGAGFDPDAASDEGFEGIGDEAAGAGGEGDSDGDGWVICTALNRMGMMPDFLYSVSSAYMRQMNPVTVTGYHFWGIPYVKLMERFSILARLAAPVARCRARHIRERLAGRGGSLAGAVAKFAVEGPSWLIGTGIHYRRRLAGVSVAQDRADGQTAL